jgi:hypothetical protein
VNTPVRWNTSSAHLSTLPGKWKEIQRGLRLVAFGYCALLLITLPGLFLVWISQGYRAHWLFERADGFTRDHAQLIGLCVAGAGTLMWYGLLVAGQWHCLSYSPQCHSAKELLFICALCLALGPTSLVTAYFMTGGEVEILFREGLSSLIRQPGLHASLLLQVGGATLIMVNLVLFSGFLRAVVKCLNSEDDAGRVHRYLWFVGFLIGGTFGMLWTPRAEVLMALASGWVISLLWHVTLINHASRLVNRVLPGGGEKQLPVERQRAKPYSGLHRYYVHVKPE